MMDQTPYLTSRSSQPGEGATSLIAQGGATKGEASEEGCAETLACFTQLYESRDGGMSLYEDADGHLIAVDPRRLV